MMVDVSHASKQTMLDAVRVSRAPVIASHSNCRRTISLAAASSIAIARGPPVKFGIQTGQQHRPFSEILRLWQVAERTGYSNAWLYDHLVPVGGDLDGEVYESWSALATLPASSVITAAIVASTLIVSSSWIRGEITSSVVPDPRDRRGAARVVTPVAGSGSRRRRDELGRGKGNERREEGDEASARQRRGDDGGGPDRQRLRAEIHVIGMGVRHAENPSGEHDDHHQGHQPAALVSGHTEAVETQRGCHVRKTATSRRGSSCCR